MQSSLFPDLQEPLAQDSETLLRRGWELPRANLALIGSRPASYLFRLLDDLRPQVESSRQVPPLFPRLGNLPRGLSRLRLVLLIESPEDSRFQTNRCAGSGNR